jgi:hypothetical protein
MKILLEQDFDLDAALSGGKLTVQPHNVVNNNNVATNGDTTPGKVDMSVLKKFGAAEKVDNGGQRFKISGNSYTFYPTGKVWNQKLGKHLPWTTKQSKVLINGIELVKPITDDKQTELGRHLAQNIKSIDRLITNAIYFNREIAAQLNAMDIDEVKVYKLCLKRLSTSAEACYVDVILRLIYPNGTMKSLISKYSTPYAYFFSRNYSSMTINSQQFNQIDSVSHGISGIKKIFSSNGKLGDWLDWDSDAGIRVLNNLMGGSGAFKIANSSTNKFELNMHFSDSQIHERVMAIWNDQLFGKPAEWIGKSQK